MNKRNSQTKEKEICNEVFPDMVGLLYRSLSLIELAIVMLTDVEFRALHRK